MGYCIGVDIGGTFTDCVAIAPDGTTIFAKTASTHGTSPVDGVLAGVDLLAEQAGMQPDELLSQVARFSHGTTIGTNLVVERNGARVGLVATAGHGDALAMMRGNGRTAGRAIDQVFEVQRTGKPTPLVAARSTIEVNERIVADGSVLVSLSDEEARAALGALLADGVEAIAIALLWSFRNDVHERRLRELVAEIDPNIFVSISSTIAPRQGEYERTVATVINSYVGPASSRYLSDLVDVLRTRGLERAPFIMQANGGVVPVAVAERAPVLTIGSGPAGGLAATAAIARRSGHRNVIATDMGGTSFEVGLIVEGQPLLASQQVLDQYSFHLAHLELQSIACGGGSIAHIDPNSGGLRVGPHSAGAVPGPACYGIGTDPTVTDADVILGLVDPDTFLGGAMKLDRAASERAIDSLATQLGISREDTAAGIVHINGYAAATLIRQRTVEQGLDPRDFTLYAFGGAGPVHAFGYAAELGVDEVVVPLGNGASSLSAFGIASSDVMRSFERECKLDAPFEPVLLAAQLETLEAEAITAMTESGFAADEVRFERIALMRYAEQFLQEVPMPIPSGGVDDATCTDLRNRFDDEYVRLFGAGARAVFQTIEIFAIRVNAHVPLNVAADLHTLTKPAVEHAVVPAMTRDIYWPSEREWVPSGVHDGTTLLPGAVIFGPAVVELPHTTLAVAPAQVVRVESNGNLILEVNS